jgi:hypothetical protein
MKLPTLRTILAIPIIPAVAYVYVAEAILTRIDKIGATKPHILIAELLVKCLA